MRNKLFAVLLTFMMIFAVSPIAYAVPENPQAFANGFSTVIKIGIVVIVTFLLLLCAVFAYGMFINRNKK